MPSLRKQPVTVQILTDILENTPVERLGIEFLEVGDDFLRPRVAAAVPVSQGDAR